MRRFVKSTVCGLLARTPQPLKPGGKLEHIVQNPKGGTAMELNLVTCDLCRDQCRVLTPPLPSTSFHHSYKPQYLLPKARILLAALREPRVSRETDRISFLLSLQTTARSSLRLTMRY
jgi:hypothetical protein